MINLIIVTLNIFGVNERYKLLCSFKMGLWVYLHIGLNKNCRMDY